MQVDGQEGYTTRQIFETDWSTNVIGTHLLTTALVPLLLKSKDPRLIFLTSGTASLSLTFDTENRLNKPPPAGWPKPAFRSFLAYTATKVALNAVMRDWEKQLRNDGVKVWCVNPGFLATGLGNVKEAMEKMGAGDPASGGEHIRDVVQGKRDADVGKIVSPGGPGKVLDW